MILEEYTTVEKEMIVDFHFPESEILKDSELIKNRESQLERAMSLGNLEHQKIKIFFEDNIGPKLVETTIWGVTDKSILLKKNVRIPKNRIINIEI